MTRAKIIAGCYGAAVCCAGIWLANRGYDSGSQVFTLSALAAVSPVGFGVWTKSLRQRWFWIALPTCILLHLALLAAIWNRFPFANGETAVGLALVEIIVLLIVCGKIMDLHPSGRAAAAQLTTSHGLLRHRKRG